MKKLLLFITIVFFVQVNGQNNTSSSKYKFNVQFTDGSNEMSNHYKLALASWDFSELDLEETTVKIQIVPIKDCYNTENAVRFKDEIHVLIDGKLNKSIDSKEFKHVDMMAKCFKWRVVINGKKGDEISQWNFYSFL